MKTRNITFSFDADVIDKAKQYAADKKTSLNKILRGLLQNLVQPKKSTTWAADFLAACDETQGDSGGKRWSREDLHGR